VNGNLRILPICIGNFAAARCYVAPMPDPFKPLTAATLSTLVTMIAVTTFVAQLLFPAWGLDTFSPFHISLAIAATLALLMSFVMGFVKRKSSSGFSFWIFSTILVGILILFEITDVGLDWLPPSINPMEEVSGLVVARLFTLISILVALVAAREVLRGRIMAAASLFCIAIYVGLNAFEDTPFKPNHFQDLGMQLLMLIALLLFLVFGYRASLQERTALAPANDTRIGEGFGRYARRLFESGPMRRSARHPPIRAAFYPVLKEATVFIAIAYLLVRAGPVLRRATGVSLFRQCKDMWLLWFREGIDPPSYYSFELYRPERLAVVPQLLTRFETKNGLFSTLNKFLANPNKSFEMNDKSQFSELCKCAGIAHPALLATVADGVVTQLGPETELSQDLFCKPRRGMGALGTCVFRYRGGGAYEHADGSVSGVQGIWEALKLQSDEHPMIVQPWLRNHAEIADLAQDSLLAFRIITCLNRDGEPEVKLAMLRLLSKLEPQWQFLPDEEYAAPIDIETGRLGLWVGDNFATSHVHMTHHPVTGAVIEGRVIQNWPALMKIACDVHKACRHRIVVGWDIALTPNGPAVLEGNSNFDVMFLQRVLGHGIGDTKLGPLLKFHLENIIQMRSEGKYL
jgi:Sugar-transfer associated ATP-grasp